MKKLAFVFVHLDVEAGGLDVEYRAIVDKKRAVNVEHLLALLKLATMRGAQAAAAPVAVFGAGLLEGMAADRRATSPPLRQDRSASWECWGSRSSSTTKASTGGCGTVAVPVNRITLLDYSEEDGAFSSER